MWFAVHNVLAVDFDHRTDTFCLNASSAWRSAASITVQAMAQGAAVLERRRHLGRPESGTQQRTSCRAWSCCSQYRLLGTFSHRRPFSDDIGTRQDLVIWRGVSIDMDETFDENHFDESGVIGR